MPCLTPYTIKDRFKSIRGEQADTTQVPCGKCRYCLRRRSSEWTFRLLEESKRSDSVCFITLTYNENHLPATEFGELTLSKADLRNFWKRLRKQVGKIHKPIKYYACGEYGGKTGRPHYHAIVFNLPLAYTTNPDLIQSAWSLAGEPIGHIHIDQGNTNTFAYVAKYIMKAAPDHKEGPGDRIPEFSTMSKGLGDNFLTPQMRKYLIENNISYVELNGYKLAMPRFYLNRLFTDEHTIEQRKAYAEKRRQYAEERAEKITDIRKQDEWRKAEIYQHRRSERESLRD
jgi:hypothetical protein